MFFLNTSAQDTVSKEEKQAREIVEKADLVRFPADGFQVDVAINSSNAGQVTESRQYRVLSKGNENTIVMVTEPAADRGQIILMKGRDLWIFLPNVSQPVRLSLAQRLTGQVANGDLARANFAGDYTPKLVRTEKLDGEDHFVLELTAVDRSVAYAPGHVLGEAEELLPRQGGVLFALGPAAEDLPLRELPADGRQAPPDATRDAGRAAQRRGVGARVLSAWNSRTCRTRSSRGTT